MKHALRNKRRLFMFEIELFLRQQNFFDYNSSLENRIEPLDVIFKAEDVLGFWKIYIESVNFLEISDGFFMDNYPILTLLFFKYTHK